MPQEQEVLHIHIIILTLAAGEKKEKRKKKENDINCNAFRADVFSAFFFFFGMFQLRFTYNLKSFIKCEKLLYIESTSYSYGNFLIK